jgi:demethylmenaquinone methyltransferase/2-methoxy-6-polyprenyl-1,4-benzoquinol methylase
MFGRVAHRYDLANHLLSFNIDRYWRAQTVARVRTVLRRPGARVIDLCCGTGDLMLALQSERTLPVFGTDFCHPMLTAASQKTTRRRMPARVFEADALQLPVRDASVDLLTVAFGFRNLANYGSGLLEMRRVLRPGGMAAILEFSQPPNAAFRALYDFYSRNILPRIGGLVSGAPDAYTYLPESVSRFPPAEQLAADMRDAGFADVAFERLTFGIVALHTGVVR